MIRRLFGWAVLAVLCGMAVAAIYLALQIWWPGLLIRFGL